jgi:hypothetical protein
MAESVDGVLLVFGRASIDLMSGDVLGGMFAHGDHDRAHVRAPRVWPSGRAGHLTCVRGFSARSKIHDQALPDPTNSKRNGAAGALCLRSSLSAGWCGGAAAAQSLSVISPATKRRPRARRAARGRDSPVRAERVPVRSRAVQHELVCAFDRVRCTGVTAGHLALSDRTFRSWQERPDRLPPHRRRMTATPPGSTSARPRRHPIRRRHHRTACSAFRSSSSVCGTSVIGARPVGGVRR